MGFGNALSRGFLGWTTIPQFAWHNEELPVHYPLSVLFATLSRTLMFYCIYLVDSTHS